MFVCIQYHTEEIKKRGVHTLVIRIACQLAAYHSLFDRGWGVSSEMVRYLQVTQLSICHVARMLHHSVGTSADNAAAAVSSLIC